MSIKRFSSYPDFFFSLILDAPSFLCPSTTETTTPGTSPSILLLYPRQLQRALYDNVPTATPQAQTGSESHLQIVHISAMLCVWEKGFPLSALLDVCDHGSSAEGGVYKRLDGLALQMSMCRAGWVSYLPAGG